MLYTSATERKLILTFAYQWKMTLFFSHCVHEGIMNIKLHSITKYQYGSSNYYLCLECSSTLRSPFLHPLCQNKSRKSAYTLVSTHKTHDYNRNNGLCINIASQHAGNKTSEDPCVYLMLWYSTPFCQSSIQSPSKHCNIN